MQKDDYKLWADQQQKIELKKALRAVKLGKPIDTIIEELAYSLTKKLLHPLYETVKEQTNSYDLEQCKQSYKENYLNKITPVADHVDENYFDNSEKR